MDAERYWDTYLEMEKENGLFDKSIEGVFFWKLIRGRVYNNILIDNRILHGRNYTVSQNNLLKVRDFIRYCGSAFTNLFKPFPRSDTLVITSARKILVNGEYQDIYTHWLTERLKRENANYLVLDVPLNWSRHPMKFDANTRKIENFTIIKKVLFKYLLFNFMFYKKELKGLSDTLIKLFGSDGNLVKEAQDQIEIFKIDYKYYLKVLRKIQPKKIWLVVGYGNHGLIAAAKNLGIETEEIQHGLISKHHMNYGFGGLKNIPYFPDRLCLYGKIWWELSDLPLDEDKIDYYKFYITNNEFENQEKKNKNSIMFLTQPTISKYIADFLERMNECGSFKDYEIIVKIHPAEYDNWRDKNPKLAILLGKMDNLQVIDNYNTPLYALFSKVETVVGVASTALFEAMCFNCKVYLLKVPCIKWMEPFGDVFPQPIKNVKELLYLLDNKVENSVNISDVFYGA